MPIVTDIVFIIFF